MNTKDKKGFVCLFIAVSIFILNALFTKIPIFFIGFSVGCVFLFLELYYFEIITKKKEG